MPTPEQMRATLGQARSSYGGQFAGQPRATRRPDRLQALIDQLTILARDAEGVDADLAAEARQQAAAWADELAAIKKVQAGGADALEASSLIQWGRDNLERYQRNFAGQNRATRDLGILLEIIADLEARLGEMDALLTRHTDDELQSSRDALLRNLATYRNEVDQIRGARRSGSLEQRAGLLAGLANEQFKRYRLHFAGKPRVSRRRHVLDTIISVLQEIRKEMVEVQAAGVQFPQQQDNIDIVDRHLKTYHRERDAIRQTRNSATRADRVKALAEAANNVFSEYRAEFPGHARSTRDEQRLNDIWETLWPVALDMEELAREDDSEPVGSNLQKVRDSLRLYEREWRLIQEAKKKDS